MCDHDLPTIESPSIQKLAGQPAGRRLRITALTLPGDTHQRLLEMGLTIGSECVVVRYAPLGDPMELKIRGYRLSLRRTEAEGICVEILN